MRSTRDRSQPVDFYSLELEINLGNIYQTTSNAEDGKSTDFFFGSAHNEQRREKFDANQWNFY